MALRATMAALIARERILIGDPSGASQVFDDLTIQNVLDETRQDLYNVALIAQPTYSGTTIQYFDYFAPPALGDFEDDLVLKQYLTTVVTPATSDDIVGHWTFAASTYPPVFITGKTYDIYRAAADLLERWAARYMTRFDFTSDSQSFHVSQVAAQLQKLAHTYRLKQRPFIMSVYRGDVASGKSTDNLLAPHDLDYYASG